LVGQANDQIREVFFERFVPLTLPEFIGESYEPILDGAVSSVPLSMRHTESGNRIRHPGLHEQISSTDFVTISTRRHLFGVHDLTGVVNRRAEKNNVAIEAHTDLPFERVANQHRGFDDQLMVSQKPRRCAKRAQ
jgi:hypothetical protein